MCDVKVGEARVESFADESTDDVAHRTALGCGDCREELPQVGVETESDAGVEVRQRSPIVDLRPDGTPRHPSTGDRDADSHTHRTEHTRRVPHTRRGCDSCRVWCDCASGVRHTLAAVVSCWLIWGGLALQIVGFGCVAWDQLRVSVRELIAPRWAYRVPSLRKLVPPGERQARAEPDVWRVNAPTSELDDLKARVETLERRLDRVRDVVDLNREDAAAAQRSFLGGSVGLQLVGVVLFATGAILSTAGSVSA